MSTSYQEDKQAKQNKIQVDADAAEQRLISFAQGDIANFCQSIEQRINQFNEQARQKNQDIKAMLLNRTAQSCAAMIGNYTMTSLLYGKELTIKWFEKGGEPEVRQYYVLENPTSSDFIYTWWGPGSPNNCQSRELAEIAFDKLIPITR